MNFVLQPWQFLFLILAGWVNREQQEVIDYLLTEIAVLNEHCGKNRLLLSDDQRRRLAVKGQVLGRKRLQEIGTLFTPDTIFRWHRQLVARKWDYSDRQDKRQCRPRVRQVIVDLAVKFAKENPSWGCDRIQGALANVGYQISDTTVENILKGHGIEPAPKRKRTGSWAPLRCLMRPVTEFCTKRAPSVESARTPGLKSVPQQASNYGNSPTQTLGRVF